MEKNNESPNCKIQSLPPIIDDDSEILILGTIPGEESLRKKEYYASPNNSFWKIMKQCFQPDVNFKNYEEKIAFLKRQHIALWDTLHSCERIGSLDKNITKEGRNKINHLLKKYPHIKKIIFNGKQASKNYQPQLPYVIACSTSNVHTITIEEKVENWAKALNLHQTESMNKPTIALLRNKVKDKNAKCASKELKGKDKFTQEEIKELERLIRLRCNAQSKGEQKKLRNAMRAIKFYGRDDWGISNMTIEKFHNLLRDKLITCTDDIQD